MADHEFTMPGKLGLEQFNRFLVIYRKWRRDHAIVKNDSLTFDFSLCHFISPLAAAFLAAEEDEYRSLGIEVGTRYATGSNILSQFRSYLSRPDASDTDARTLMFDKYTVKVTRCTTTKEIMRATEEIVRHLKEKMNLTRSLESALSWAIFELVDNGGIHGYRCYDGSDFPKPVYVCARQHIDNVEIAVIDRGQGIYENLKEAIELKNAKEALKMALQEGISGHPNGSPGFGLWGASELARRSNAFFGLWSSGRYLAIKNKEVRESGGSNERGTLVAMRFLAGTEVPFEEIVSQKPDDYLEDMADLEINW